MQQNTRSHLWKSFLYVVSSSVLFFPAITLAQVPAQDPVEGLRKALQNAPPDVAEHKKQVVVRVDALQGLDALRRGLILPWRPKEDKDPYSLAEQDVRSRLVARFQKEVRTALKEGTVTKRLATISMLAAMAPDSVIDADNKDILRVLGPDLVELVTKTNSAQVRCAAAQALGSIRADPSLVAPALRELLGKKDLEERRAAASGLLAIERDIFKAASRWRGYQSPVIGGADIVGVGRVILPIAGRGLSDADPEVRRQCLQTIHYGAESLSIKFPSLVQRDWNDGRVLAEIQASRKDTLPLVEALRDQISRIGPCIKDPSMEMQIAACKTLESIADARSRMIESFAILPAEGKSTDGKKTLDSLGQSLRKVASTVAENLSAKEVRVRLAAIYVLESMESEAAPAVTAVVKALQDTDPFVRWGAVRALGRMAPHESDKAVPALASVVGDLNNDVRITALAALERFGPKAKAAVPLLRPALGHKDGETRKLAIQALIAIGKEAHAAIPELVEALTDADASIRAAAAQALGKLSPHDDATVKALTKSLNDPDSDVRLAAAAALLAGK